MNKKPARIPTPITSILIIICISVIISILIYLFLLIIFSMVIIDYSTIVASNPIEWIKELIYRLRDSKTDPSTVIYNISQASMITIGVLTGASAAILALRKHIIDEKNQYLSEEESRLERFNKSLSLLFDGNVESRILAIYTLERIAYESKNACTIVVESLTNWFKKRIEEKDSFENTEYLYDAIRSKYRTVKKLPEDVRIVLNVLSRIAKKNRYISLDLSNLDLSNLYIGAVDLSRASLRHSNLSHSYLMQAIFEEADLKYSILDDTDLRQANLTKALLGGSHCEGTNMTSAILRLARIGGPFCLERSTYVVRCRFDNASLRKAYLGYTNLTSSQFFRSDISGASFEYSILSDSYFYNNKPIKNVDFSHAVMTGINGVNLVHFWRCNFDYCNLEGVDFSETSFTFCSAVEAKSDY